MADGEGMSKSAKRRAAKKANAAAGQADEAAQQPAPAKPAQVAPPSAPGGYPEPTAKAKAKAQPGQAAPASAQPKAQPKAAAKAEPEKKEAPKAAAKASSKAKGKATPKAVAKEEPAAKPAEDELSMFQQVDDGTGADWETCTGLTKKQARQKERQEEAAKAAKAAGPAAVNNKYIPGLVPAPGQHIPGMAPATKGSAKVADVAPGKKEAEAKAASGEQEVAPKADAFTATVQVPEKVVGIVIGPKGSKLKMIQEKTGVTRIDTSGDTFTITGPADAVAAAEKAINDLKVKGYTELAFEDFSENVVKVHPKTFPDLIGKGGVTIMALKEQLKVEITIPKTGPAGGKWNVTIAGKQQDVERAKQVINELQMYYHSEVTHPGQVHEEIEVPAWAYAWIIGKAGSELRHIQNNYKVRMYIPREGVSTNENVVIVGEKSDVPRAVAYVQKVLSGAADASKGRDRQEKADDGWGDEGEEEDWMKQYMYKRR
jgi:rRNA processing protein Krr1/Pno1|eukprot:TRINITY_DN208_c0_g2_i1.p1 TRINITY_DN208_c0_g2~~TRINITY_DN208_c0_g2_i1.p1  ORF type:complete len:506 (+),score=124.78 TRINITY_DN208_c0_g2_i1:62-1519(+)